MKSNIKIEQVRERITELLRQAAERGSEAVYGVKNDPQTLFISHVKALALDAHGQPDVEPGVLESRAAAERERSDAAYRRAAASMDRWRTTAAAVSGTRPLFGWQGSSIILLAAAVVGFALPAPGWRTCAILVLSAALCVLALPLIPGAIRSVVLGCRTVLACVGDAAKGFAAARASQHLEARALAAADHAALVDEWVAVQMAHLTAEFEYHRGLAVVAGSSN